MSENIEDLTVSYSENGKETVKELDKCILTKGAWTTIIFRYQDWDNSKNEYGPPKFSIRRYQKKNNQYWQKSKFTISSNDQAKKIISILSEWIEK
ncbi:Uncharacterised protein (plasmid) [Legionella adelaidensis]|uniref:Uncharacterized protein n=1 Tax=Legionella adelaidensis TaxID=45056 RepID=A0A0W0R2Z4_9GAMM|nr:hypothetical protein [Legionella adelaidensis]KTC65420.1 hypothetical protein Lade_0078 [Legionella adelaidensis]VEH84758.1 Uncharacterised protein [Legionella adelaidensis]